MCSIHLVYYIIYMSDHCDILSYLNLIQVRSPNILNYNKLCYVLSIMQAICHHARSSHLLTPAPVSCCTLIINTVCSNVAIVNNITTNRICSTSLSISWETSIAPTMMLLRCRIKQTLSVGVTVVNNIAAWICTQSGRVIYKILKSVLDQQVYDIYKRYSSSLLLSII